MAKILNTFQEDSIKNYVQSAKEQLVNPYTATTNVKNATIVDFWNVNTQLSTLDENSKLSYSSHGKESPIKYDLIEGLYLYGMSKFTDTTLENGDFGLETSSKLEGEATLLSNTIIPVPGSFFVVKDLKEVGLFKVTNVDVDAIENGSNFWKIEYKLDKKDIHLLDDQVANRYKFVVNNSGTNLSPVVLKEAYDLASKVENVLSSICQYYVELFFNDRVETFTVNYNGKNFYDPMLVEFIRRNKLLDHLEKYMYVEQQISLSKTFSIEYANTLFNAMERQKIKGDLVTTAVGRFIDQPLSILTMRREDYFEVKYVNHFNLPSIHEYRIETYNDNFIEFCKNNRLYERNNMFLNLIIQYFNDKEITENDLALLEDLEYAQSIDLFYQIPLILFVLRYNLLKLLS